MMKKENIKTRYCENISKTGKCRHGAKCLFAHSIDELQIPPCGYGANCIFVTKNAETGKWESRTDTKTCQHLHPQEAKSDFLLRTNQTLDQKCRPSPERPLPLLERTPRPPSNFQLPPAPLSPFPTTEERSLFSSPALAATISPIHSAYIHPEDSITLHVPETMAEKSLQVAMQMGKRVIHLKILTDEGSEVGPAPSA